MRRFLLAAALAAVAVTQRPKVKDHHSHLIDVSDVGESCADTYTGYAIVDGSLERCDNLTSIQMGGSNSQREREYEKYKCKHLRVHGEIRSEKCVCRGKFKGPICNDYEGCPTDKPSLFQGVCSKNGCAHDGTMAIGSTQMECICKDQWDGRHCDRLACWRLTNKGLDKRYRNSHATQSCECGVHYEGENCATVKSCERNGKFKNGMCVCSEGYGGETCNLKCAVGQVTCSTCSIFSAILLLPVLATVFHRLL